MKTFFNCLILCLSIGLSGYSQQAFQPLLLDSSINSNSNETDPILSADGRVLYFTRTGHPKNGPLKSAVWISEKNASNNWRTPVLVAELNKGKHNRVLSLSGNQSKLLLQHDSKIILYLKNGDHWEENYSLPTLSKDMSLSMDEKFLIYIKRNFLHILEQNEGKWIERSRIRLSMKHTHSPFMNNQTIFFNASKKGYGTDIFVLEKLGDDGWSFPRRLSDTINTKKNERQMRTTANGAHGVYVSDVNSNDDLYLIKFFEENPFVYVEGRFLNALSGKLITGKSINLEISPDHNVFQNVNCDSGTFMLKLPFAKQYQIKISSEFFQPDSIEISTVEQREHTTNAIDVVLSPLPYVAVTGNLTISGSNQKIPLDAQTKVLVDSVVHPSAEIDYVEGMYTLKLNHGLRHTLQLRTKDFVSSEKVIDLSAVDSYQKIEANLEVDLSRYAKMRLEILDGQGGKEISPEVPVSIRINESKCLLIRDSLLNIYDVWTGTKGPYKLSVSAPGYCPYYKVINVDELNGLDDLKKVNLIPIEPGNSMRFNEVSFETGKTSLEGSSFAELDRLAQLMHDRPSMRIEIAAHTHNASRISTLTRAREVVTYLVSKGINKSRLEARGYGSTKPLAPHGSGEGKNINTRIEYTIIEK